MPVPVIGMVARCTMKTANPMGRGASTCSDVDVSQGNVEYHIVLVNPGEGTVEIFHVELRKEIVRGLLSNPVDAPINYNFIWLIFPTV